MPNDEAAGHTEVPSITARSRASRVSSGSLQRLELLLTDGSTLPLVATETSPLPEQRQCLKEQAVGLRRWLSDNAYRWRKLAELELTRFGGHPELGR